MVTKDGIVPIKGGQAKVLDSGQIRDLTRIEDTLENMDIAHFLVTPQDIPQDGFEMITFAEMLKNNTRNFYALVGGCAEGLRYCCGDKRECFKRRCPLTDGKSRSPMHIFFIFRYP